MNKVTLTITAATVSSLFAAGFANADFQGFSIDETFTSNGATYSVYVDVEEGDQLDAVFGDGVDPLFVRSDNGFYQHMFGSHRPPNPAFFGLFPSVQYDSFVTIGLSTSTGNEMLDIGVDWTVFEGNVADGTHNNGGDIDANNGSWFATPSNAQVFEVDGRVLIGQFTVAIGDHVFGQINIQGKNADLTNWQYRGVTFDSIPAPGALALLGLAGIAARRRRK